MGQNEIEGPSDQKKDKGNIGNSRRFGQKQRHQDSTQNTIELNPFRPEEGQRLQKDADDVHEDEGKVDDSYSNFQW